MSKHTPVPWSLGKIRNDGDPMLKCFVAVIHHGPKENQGNAVAWAFNGHMTGRDAAEKNAEFIVRACNAHDQMLEALKAQASWTMRDGTPCACPAGKNEYEPKGRMPIMHSTSCEMLRTAVAKAEEKKS